jgi:ubiquinone/menaquinone biosynthesis C-methylase UbiE
MFLLVGVMSLYASGTYALATGKKASQTLSAQDEIMAKETEKHLSKAKLKNTDQVLEIGCGTGSVTKRIAPRVASVIALDISERQIEEAKNYVHSSKVTFMVGDIMDPNFALKIGKKFDVVYARLVFMHLTNPEIALKNIYKVLKPGGVVLLQESTIETLHSKPVSKAVDHYRDLVIALGNAKGVNYNIGRQLADLCRKVGFIKIDNYFSESMVEDAVPLFEDRLSEWGPKAIEMNIASKETIDQLYKDFKELAKIPGVKISYAEQSHIIAYKPIE